MIAHPVTAGSCADKRRYRRSTTAKRAIRRAQTYLGGRRLHAYHCGLCGYWHMGHPTPWRNQ